MEYGTFEEGPQISTNQRRESTVFSLLIGRNLRPSPDNTVLYNAEKPYCFNTAAESILLEYTKGVAY